MSIAHGYAKESASSERHALVGNLDTVITPRQLEVLALIASGYSYAEAAQLKFYSPHTVQNYAKAAVARSGARSTTHLIAMLVEQRLIKQNSDGYYEPVQDLRIAGE